MSLAVAAKPHALCPPLSISWPPGHTPGATGTPLQPGRRLESPGLQAQPPTPHRHTPELGQAETPSKSRQPPGPPRGVPTIMLLSEPERPEAVLTNPSRNSRITEWWREDGGQLGAKGPSFLSCCQRTPPPTASRVGDRPGSGVGPRWGWKTFPSCDPSPVTLVSPHHGERTGRLTPGHPGRSPPGLAPCLPRPRDQEPRCSDPGCPQPSEPAPEAPWP